MARRDPETNPRAFLGAELRRGRVAAGFSSQDALAAHLGFDRTVITKAETGNVPRRPRSWLRGPWRAIWMRICSGDSLTWPGQRTGRFLHGSRLTSKRSGRR